MTLRELYKYAEVKLNNLDYRTLKYELRLILEHYLNMKETEILLNKDIEIPGEKLKLILKAIEKRSKGYPLQYIIGTWNFMDINLSVGNGVLIPRDDTQVLVESVISKLKNLDKAVAVDLCSGTGCISFALEKYLKCDLDMYAIELSKDAYKYLVKNIDLLNSKVKPINGDIFIAHENFKDEFFDCVISNPPYIRSKDINDLQKEVLYEPNLALDGGKDGLEFYRNICKTWISKIKHGGFLAFEIGIGQFEDIKNIMIDSGITNICFERDINRIIRSMIGIKY